MSRVVSHARQYARLTAAAVIAAACALVISPLCSHRSAQGAPSLSPRTAPRVILAADYSAARRSAYREVTVSGGDTLSLLAWKAWRDAGAWPAIWRDNSARVPDPNLITVGERLLVPFSRPAPSQAALPPAPRPRRHSAPPVATVSAGGSAQQIARQMLADDGMSSQWNCLDDLWERESGWDIYARNPSSGAYGIPQSLPADKMSAAGSDWGNSAYVQVKWGLQLYILPVYGSPCGAWDHEEAQGWY